VVLLSAHTTQSVFFMNIGFMFVALGLMGFFFSTASIGFAKAVNTRLTEVRNKNLIIEARQKQMEENMALARAIQRNVLPGDRAPGGGIEFSALYLPADQLGGDLYDFIEFPGSGKTGVFISDVSGHGVPAALIVGMVKILLNTAGGIKSSPSAVLSYINSHLRGLTVKRFITVFYGIFDRETRTFTYARAAHNYPLLLRKSLPAPVPLKSRGPVLGIFENVTIEERSIILEEGDKIIFYTDGLTEARDVKGRYFEERLARLLEESRDTDVKSLVAKIAANLADFMGKDGKIADDVCLVGMEILRKP
jgi:sigma-B regulation protein RsbU (phosphoserine phosphatase)